MRESLLRVTGKQKAGSGRSHDKTGESEEKLQALREVEDVLIHGKTIQNSEKSHAKVIFFFFIIFFSSFRGDGIIFIFFCLGPCISLC